MQRRLRRKNGYKSPPRNRSKRNDERRHRYANDEVYRSKCKDAAKVFYHKLKDHRKEELSLKQQQAAATIALHHSIAATNPGSQDRLFQCFLKEQQTQLFGNLVSASVKLEEHRTDEAQLLDNLLECDLDVDKEDNVLLDSDMPSVINMALKISAEALNSTNHIVLTKESIKEASCKDLLESHRRYKEKKQNRITSDAAMAKRWKQFASGEDSPPSQSILNSLQKMECTKTQQEIEERISYLKKCIDYSKKVYHVLGGAPRENWVKHCRNKFQIFMGSVMSKCSK